MTKPKANIFDLPLDQKFLIVATWLSTEYLAKIAMLQGRPHDILVVLHSNDNQAFGSIDKLALYS
jgi:hypothetical protein